MTEEEINKVINSSCQNLVTENSNDPSSLKQKKETKINSNYSDPLLQILIVKKKKEGLIYELTLLGITVVMDNLRFPNGSHKRPVLFYTSTNLKQYFDSIALNYKNKIPLIFGKWDLLKSQLGTMLYDSFDFLIYKANRSRTINETVWSGGTKEYYEDLQTLSFKAIRNLYPVFLSGKMVVEEFESHQTWLVNDSRMAPIYNKLREIEGLLIYADIPDQSEYLTKGENTIPNRDEIEKIEYLFKDEITFLFYLSLNTRFLLTRSYKYPSRSTKYLEDGGVIIPHEAKDEDLELHELGSPHERLMMILSKDKEVKNWLSIWIASIIEYRRKTSEEMLDFYNKINNRNRKRKSNHAPSKGITIFVRPNRLKASILHEEYNMAKIIKDL
jgi:hypothetical protein